MSPRTNKKVVMPMNRDRSLVAANSLSIKRFIAAAFLFAAVSMLLGCSDNLVEVQDGRILITDRTGKKWDITHAVNAYGLDPDNFNFGLGPNAITPINYPEALSPGEAGYPPSESTTRVIGTVVDGEARGYPIPILSQHEVVNDLADTTHIAVLY